MACACADGHMYAGGYVCERRAERAYLLSKRKNEKCGKTRVANIRVTGRVSVRDSEWGICGTFEEAGIWKVGGEMVET